MLTEKNITIGSDPEFFISETLDGKEFVVLPILLEENGLNILRQEMREDDSEIVAHSYYLENDRIKIMSDGSALELTTKPYELSEMGKLFDDIHYGYSKAKKLINPFKYNLSIVPTINFDTVKFGQEKKYIVASQAGCDPDYDAWDDSFECKTISISNYPYRHGGGHLHFGINDRKYLKEFHRYSQYGVRLLSMVVGSYFLINSPQNNLDLIRMDYFGKPGKYRKPDYGIEYRSPSNAWTTSKEVFLNSKKWILLGLNLLFHQKSEEILEKFSEEFKDAYKTQNFSELQKIMQEIEKIYHDK